MMTTRANDHDIALRRMEHAGAVVTTAEAMIMELQQRYTTPTFRQIRDHPLTIGTPAPARRPIHRFQAVS